MQTIYQNEKERSGSGGANLMGSLICTERIGRYMEGEHTRRFRRRTIGI